jgi:hypothetical protein
MLLLALAACLGLSPGSNDPATAVMTEGASDAHDTLDMTRVKADLGVIRSQLKLYAQTHEGEGAPDIASLGVSGLSFPDRYAYDPAAGTVIDPEHPTW